LAIARIIRFNRDDSGSTMVEHTVTMLTFFLILFGIIEFSYLYYQWNAATKAVQFGARLAAVSDPIASGLRTYTGLTNANRPGDALPANAYDVTCRATGASAATVTCTGTFTAATSASFRRIVFGEPTRTVCVDPAPTPQTVGMCNYFSRLQANNVVVRYQYTGLGYVGRPGGAVPTVTVSLSQTVADRLQFQFVFLNALSGLLPVTMPTFSTTVTGEDLNIAPPA
jgi:Flp pilus assembly protein TadG